MKNDKIKNISLTLSFFSITLGWISTLVWYSIYSSWTASFDTEIGAITSWSGLFSYVGWLIFIIYPIRLLDSKNKLLKRYIFPFFTTVYGGLTYTILAGGIFLDFLSVIAFLPLALSIGFIFGLTYATLIANERIVNLLNQKPTLKILSFLSPILIFTLLLWVLPTLIPSLVFRYMPENIQDKILAKTIIQYKVGDSFEELSSKIPGHFEKWGSSGYYSGPLIEYQIEIENDTIKILDVKLLK